MACGRYQRLSQEEKNKKIEYARTRYHDKSEKVKQKIKDCKKIDFTVQLKKNYKND